MSKRDFKIGIKDGLPICFGYFAVSFSFGIFAISSGLSILEATLMSLTNLTSAGQLAAVPIIASSGLLLELALAQLVINLRYSLMSLTLSQRFDKSVKLYDRFLIAFGNTDEIFAVSVSKPHLVTRSYMYGLILTPLIGWTTGTLIGALIGNVLPIEIMLSLQVAIYGMFVAIVVPPMKADKSILFCVLIAVALSCAFYYIPFLSTIPSGFTIIICAVVASVIMAIVKPIKRDEKGENDDDKT